MRLCISLGTRPEIIKMAPLVWECEKRGLNYFILHTGQHYSENMDQVFFRTLNLPEPLYNIHTGSGSHAEQTAKILIEAEKIFLKERPDIVLVQGDTNSTLAVSLTAVKLGIPVGHVEAGLRCGDMFMPEEINRKLTDHISSYLFAPTQKSFDNLQKEGIDSKKIFITGNTIVDAIYTVLKNVDNLEHRTLNLELQIHQRIYPSTHQHRTLNVEQKNYFLLTLHRQENVDNKDRLISIFKGLKLVYSDYNLPIIYPVHPRTEKRLSEFEIKVPDGIILTEPLDYFEFLQLEKDARLIFTDSGGVQEEACILHTPCVTLRYNTERPETVDVGANILSGTNPHKILESVKLILNTSNPHQTNQINQMNQMNQTNQINQSNQSNQMNQIHQMNQINETGWQNPFGDGKAAERIIDILQRNSEEVGKIA